MIQMQSLLDVAVGAEFRRSRALGRGLNRQVVVARNQARLKRAALERRVVVRQGIDGGHLRVAGGVAAPVTVDGPDPGQIGSPDRRRQDKQGDDIGEGQGRATGRVAGGGRVGDGAR